MMPNSRMAYLSAAAESQSNIAWLFQYRELFRNLIAKELKVKYRGSIIGILWSLVNPLMIIAVYSVAFNFILRIPLENYALFLVIGVLHWNVFAASTMASADAIIANANLIHKVKFPRLVLPLSIVAFQFIQLALALVAFGVAYLPLGGEVWTGLLAYPGILVLQACFVAGVSMGVAALTVFYRDLKHLVEVGLMLLFWLTPIIYNFTMIPEFARIWFRLNPMVSFVISYQDILYLQEWPSLGNWMFMIGLTGAVLALGYWIFQRLQHRFAEEV